VVEDLRDRLRRLRREPSPALQPELERAELPDWLRGRIARERERASEVAGRARTTGDPAGLQLRAGPRGEFAARDSLHPLDARHGRYALREALALEPGALRLLTRGGLPIELDVEGAVFLDIETTGLSGGAGTQAFLVGLGWFEPQGFRVRQAFLRGPQDEPAVLAACAERLAAARLLVSFFGKTFDRHRLEDKMRQHGVPPPFAALPHADLYWPARRLYRAATADARLATMELALCGFEREQDLSGAHAPGAWFDFLAGRSHLLEEVFRHNLHDVLSLAALLAHLGRAPAGARADGSELDGEPELAAARALALAELHLERKEPEQALRCIARAKACAGARELGCNAQLLEARALARAGRRAEALDVLLAVPARSDRAALAALEAARVAKRLGKPPAELEVLAQRALELARTSTSGVERARLEREATKLLERLRTRGEARTTS
jgi:uncharacterized protein YprB with RNaseH-like and TPR domain